MCYLVITLSCMNSPYCLEYCLACLMSVLVLLFYYVTTLYTHLSTSVYCFIVALIVHVHVNHCQLATVHLSISLPCVSLTIQVISPARNQSLPVSSHVEPHYAQSCLLDCTGVFSQSFQAFFMSPEYLQSCHSLVLSSHHSLFFCLHVYLFLVSQFPSR